LYTNTCTLVFRMKKKSPLIYSVSQVKVNNKETLGRRLFTRGITIIWKKQRGKGILAPSFYIISMKSEA
jgi:hypothetical protein